MFGTRCTLFNGHVTLSSYHPISPIMAPRSTRPASRSAPAPLSTRKRGESDANEPPKRRRTRHSKGGSDDDHQELKVDERELGRAAKPKKKGKKGR